MTIQPHQPSTDLAQPGTVGANLIREAAAVMADAHALAKAVAGTQMIPKHFQGKPDECAAAMLYGASLGLDPMQSVRQIYVVHGQAALYARAMAALTMGVGHDVWTVETSDTAVTVAGQRRGSQHVEQSTWTYERAKKAGYTSNNKYQQDPQAMLYSKAVSEVCRKIAPDVLSGVYSVEEMQLEGAHQPTRHSAPGPAFTAPQEDETVEGEVVEESEPITDKTRRHLFALFTQKGIPEEQQLAGINYRCGTAYTSRSQLTEANGRTLIEHLSSLPDAAAPEATEPADDAQEAQP